MSNTKIPKSVKVCGVSFEIIRATPEECKDLFDDDGVSLLDGFCCFERCKIYLRKGQVRSKERDTLAHEIAHAFIHLSGLGHAVCEALPASAQKKFSKLEEVWVRGATPHIVNLIRENPELWRNLRF